MKEIKFFLRWGIYLDDLERFSSGLDVVQDKGPGMVSGPFLFGGGSFPLS